MRSMTACSPFGGKLQRRKQLLQPVVPHLSPPQHMPGPGPPQGQALSRGSPGGGLGEGRPGIAPAQQRQHRPLFHAPAVHRVLQPQPEHVRIQPALLLLLKAVEHGPKAVEVIPVIGKAMTVFMLQRGVTLPVKAASSGWMS